MHGTHYNTMYITSSNKCYTYNGVLHNMYYMLHIIYCYTRACVHNTGIYVCKVYVNYLHHIVCDVKHNTMYEQNTYCHY